MKIHPSAVIDPAAQLGRGVEIGPWSVVEGDTEIGDGCVLASHVVVKRGTRLGAANQLFEGVVLGGLPQHARMPESVGRLVIGESNTFREHVTVHRALDREHATTVGASNLVMVGAHIAHDCVVGDGAILANNVMLAGHVVVEDRAYLSGGVGVHQFCRVGRLAMVGGLARIVQDVPPFVMVDGDSNLIVGLNTVGLRRNGYTTEQIAELKAAYRMVYRSGLRWVEILERLRETYADGPAANFWQFLGNVRRGIVQERRAPPGATLRIRTETDEGDEPLSRAKAG